MIWKITFRDLAAFWRSDTKVFAWLVFCMICGSFVLNYSYSFARYRGELYERNSGASAAGYQVSGRFTCAAFSDIMNEISSSAFPEITEHQLFTTSFEGYSVVGSSYISKNSSAFTGLWREGYAAEIEFAESYNACAVSDRVLDYNDRLKMTGEIFYIDNEEFVICGVYEMSVISDVVVFSDKFLEKYSGLEKFWITFSERLSSDQEQELIRLIKAHNADCAIILPAEQKAVSSDIVRSNELQYTAIIVMLIVCIVSILKYLQEVNIPACTIYWICGAAHGTMLLLTLCESVVLCVSAYLAGLGLNALSRLLIPGNSPLGASDVLLGFGVFFGVFTVFTLINTLRICRSLNVKNVRRD